MKYRYENLSSEQFEKLIVLLCQELLGISVQGFAKGPDGGRDAKFVGTAEIFPSKTGLWEGTTIIQAKHTNGYNRRFSEKDFFNPASEHNVIAKEIPRIRKLRKKNELDHYMLFANRRLGGNTVSEICSFIANKCDIPEASIYLCGSEQLEVWFKKFPDVPEMADVDPVDSPLIISPDELSEVVEALVPCLKSELVSTTDDLPEARLAYERKNEINNLSKAYALYQRKRYLKETHQIKTFLAAPENLPLLHRYETAADEFQNRILANRKDYQSFDKVMEYLADLLFDRDPVLRSHKTLTRVILFYMYWNCDIGEGEDAAADQAHTP
jgi:hypothetical protein